MNPIISAPHAWSWPTGIVVLLLILGLLLFVQDQWFAYVEHRQRKQPALVAAPVATTAAPMVKNAELRLHIFGDERQPTPISLHNVWRWYYLRNILVGIDKETGRRVEHIILSLFILFDQLVAIGTPEVTAGFQLPRYEVKDFSNRAIIVGFSGDLPAGDLTVTVRP